jgi:hypothetical protein
VARAGYRDQAAQELKAKPAGRPPAPTETARAILPLLEALLQSVAAQGANGAATPGQAPGVPQAGEEDGIMLPQLLPMLAMPAAPFDTPEYSFEVK